ncbi:hypothetical protein JHK82_052843 [Glycine max]|nr:hypothetical protein JHK86_052697 [Glycine max]KAG4915222.1 hypothetical protein JHK87_052779 [Glycine soja]KAG4927064.1 hypothetical protein JHK85_053550 [Glycine max]KAG5082688.1 hypothetical protein JHK84_052726 [Glycine max]KAG5085446.1 hypothetical protein JHK82_052843 [Glycine max]
MVLAKGYGEGFHYALLLLVFPSQSSLQEVGSVHECNSFKLDLQGMCISSIGSARSLVF